MGPGNCLWAGGAEFQALLCFPGDWGAGLALPSCGGGDTAPVLYLGAGLY